MRTISVWRTLGSRQRAVARCVLALLWCCCCNDVLANTTPSDTPAASGVERTKQEAAPASSDRTGLQGRPRWEFGVGLGYVDAFDYPGSADPNQRSFALPFFIYRSERFRFGGGGISAVSIEKPTLSLDWSVSASLNASSQGNAVRDGMEDLDFLLELGPQLVCRLVDRKLTSGDVVQLDWRTKLRGVVSIGSGNLTDRGAVFETTLGARLRGVAGNRNISLFGSVGATAATERLQDYFYEVRQEFVSPTRPAYDAKGGLLEVSAAVGIALSLPRRVRVFMGVSNGFFAGAANRDSPLHEVVRSTSAAVGVVWTIGQSKERVGILDTQ